MGEVYRGPSAPCFPTLPTGTWEGLSGLRAARAAPGKELPAGIRDGAKPAVARPGTTAGAERDTVGAEVVAARDATPEVRTPSWQTEL
jgi:hypothetical protein